jgi:hypothetical protein
MSGEHSRTQPQGNRPHLSAYEEAELDRLASTGTMTACTRTTAEFPSEGSKPTLTDASKPILTTARGRNSEIASAHRLART